MPAVTTFATRRRPPRTSGGDLAPTSRGRAHPAQQITSARPGPPRRRASARVRRRRVAAVLTLTVAVLAIVATVMAAAPSGTVNPPPGATTTPVRTDIVAAAESQLGYETDPAHSYCNKFSAYWGVGTRCGHGLRAEEWCADFAAWTWRKGGAAFTYSFGSGGIDSSAISFYTWAVDHGTWHPAGDYHPRPGDVAVYGLTLSAGTAVHVAVVTGSSAGARGPDVVNGDGDIGAFSIVQAEQDQYQADAPGGPAHLDGYASPVVPAPPHHSS